MKINPVTLEVVRNGFISIAEEMGAGLVRSGYSPSLTERKDCSCSVYDKHGLMIAQAEHIPIHLGVMPQAIKGIFSLYPDEEMHPDDMFVLNDPYFGGNHLPDIIVIAPIFYEKAMLGFAASMVHHSDVGGVRPRSMPGSSTEIFQEGIRIPGVRLVDHGRIDRHVMRFITTNSRTPLNVAGDLRAQIAANFLACRRLDSLCRKYGRSVIEDCMRLIQENSERHMRAELAKLAAGTYFGESYVDRGTEKYRIVVTVKIAESSLTLDFTGTDPQTVSPVNAAPAATWAAIMFAVKSLTDPTIMPNWGTFKPISAVLPEGTIINPRSPAPVAGSCEVSYKTIEAIFKALETVCPERVIAGCGAGGVFSCGGYDARKQQVYAYGEALGGGYGASAVKDGESACMPTISNIKDSPVEVVEMKYPVRVLRFELRRDSAGDGRFRGGFGFCRSFKMLDGVSWSIQTTMSSLGPLGARGGTDGEVSQCIVNPGTQQERDLSGYCDAELTEGEVLEIRTAGGGGFGDPAEREPSLVREDVLNGLLSPDKAARVYGEKVLEKGRVND